MAYRQTDAYESLQLNVNSTALQMPTLLTFRGLCIVIYSYNKTNEMH
jgi:hypothetical protein